MTGPSSERTADADVAKIEEAFLYVAPVHASVVRDARESLAALRLRNQQLQEALADALDCKGSYGGTVSESGGSPAICPRCASSARAALASVRASTSARDGAAT